MTSHILHSNTTFHHKGSTEQTTAPPLLGPREQATQGLDLVPAHSCRLGETEKQLVRALAGFPSTQKSQT